MSKTMAAPASEISQFAPKITSFYVDEDKIGLIIGPGGKTIKGISEKSGSSINIDDDGRILIYGKDTESAKRAEEMVKGLIEEPEVGRIYDGTVKRLMDFGAFVEILPGKEGLVHISRLSRERVENVSDVLSEGQEIKVKILEVDRMGRLNLSYIDAIDPDGSSPVSSQPRRPSSSGPRGPRRN
jgi:polyribonucleotide nucleotidyltransferase